jgi:hypothetical protein
MPQYLNTAEAMKNGCTDVRLSQPAAEMKQRWTIPRCFKMFAQRTVNSACHVPSGAYTLNGDERGDNSISESEKPK